MGRLDKPIVERIIREKRKGVKNETIAETAKVSVRHVQRLWREYRNMPAVEYPKPIGRPANGLPGRREHSAVLSAAETEGSGARILEDVIESGTGIHIPHNAIHGIMKDNELASDEPKKKGRRKWVRYEREHSNSMWHTDYKQLDDGTWFIAYQDDASRFVTGYGVFESATAENALSVLGEAVKNHGRPASILTDHGSQFFANEAREKKKGESVFEETLRELGIRHILARVRHPQTNGKLERLHGELQRKLHRFEDVAGPPGTGAPVGVQKIDADPVARFIHWYNHRRPHESLDWDSLETPAQAFDRKKAPEDGPETVKPSERTEGARQ